MKRVLIAEDEEALLDVFAAIVSEMGHEAMTAANGDDAFRLAVEQRPDLIVSDYMMPRRNGVELLRALRATPELRETPFILISAAKPRGLEEASRYLTKPVALETFEEAVRTELERAARREDHAAITPAQQSALNLARDEMLNWVSHEIRTPLSAAKITLQLVRRHLVAGPEASQVRRIDTVLHELDGMNALVTSVLEAASLSEGRIVLEKGRHDLGQFLTQFVARWRDLQPQLSLRLDLPPAAVVVSFDALRITQVLDNFLSNAVKYCGEACRVEVSVSVDDATVGINVRDYGEGIEAEELPHLFDRFHRAKNARGAGHGLGLYIASALARLHGGDLRVQSARGRGASFTLVLPRS